MEEKRSTLSRSKTGELQIKPTKQQRDAAYSTGAGRKAVEVEIDKHTRQPKAPIGLELETRGQQLTHRKMSF
jgi:hypothetical protein